MLQGQTIGAALDRAAAAIANAKMLLGLGAETTTTDAPRAPTRTVNGAGKTRRRTHSRQRGKWWTLTKGAGNIPNDVRELTGMKTRGELLAKWPAGSKFAKGEPLPPQLATAAKGRGRTAEPAAATAH